MPRTVAVIPAFNEEDRVVPVIKGAKAFVDEVIVIDDGSSDATFDVASAAGAHVRKLKVNSGKGAALREGMARALERKADILVLLDADGQHDPKYIPEFVAEIKGGADLVYGKRNLTGYPISRKIGNWGLTTLCRIFCPTRIRDTESGYRALTADAARKVELKAKHYATEMDFIHAAWKNRFKVAEVRIDVPVFIPKPAFVRGWLNFFYLLKRRFNLI